MLKKITLSLMVNVLFMQQSFAGIGSSTPLNQEQEVRPIRRGDPTQRIAHMQRPISPDNSDDDAGKIIAGLAGLAIGGAIVYGLYKSSQEPEPPRKPATRNFQDSVLEPTGGEASHLNSRRVPAKNYENSFSYVNEGFSEEAWRRANGLPNKFPTAHPQRGYERPFYPRNNITRDSESSSNESSSNESSSNESSSNESSSYSVSSSYSETEETSESSDAPQTHRGCPLIDLRDYDTIILHPEAALIDLHPVYNRNFTKHLRDEIYKRQLAYHLSETKENKLYIITGTGKQRPGPNFRLQNAVQELLKENYFRCRIAHYRLEKDGLFAIFLKKNKTTTTNQGQDRKKAA